MGPPNYPPAPPPPPELPAAVRPRPPQLRPVIVLLLTNLGLSILLTVVVLVVHRSVVDYQLDHRHVTDPDLRSTLRHTYTVAVWGRVAGNVVASVVYVFLVRALLRGRRWAYRRVILLGVLGIVGLALLLPQPYPPWMKAEQGVQALVLAGLLYFVLRPEVRTHFAKR